MNPNRPVITIDTLSQWTIRNLRSAIVNVFFESGHLSAVFGVELEDGNRVVVKARRYEDRLIGCAEVHQRVWATGFKCPEPLVGLDRIGDLAFSAERFCGGGQSLAQGLETARISAGVLAELVRVAPAPAEVRSLEPLPPWLAWSQRPGRLWPDALDVDADLNDGYVPRWLEDVARAVRSRLSDLSGSLVVGHGDWLSENARFEDGELVAVDDWDSVVALPEPAVAGAAAALVFGGASNNADVEAFLAGYEEARGTSWSVADKQIAWAAGLWARAFEARAALALGYTAPAESLHAELERRLERAGIAVDLRE